MGACEKPCQRGKNLVNGKKIGPYSLHQQLRTYIGFRRVCLSDLQGSHEPARARKEKEHKVAPQRMQGRARTHVTMRQKRGNLRYNACRSVVILLPCLFLLAQLRGCTVVSPHHRSPRHQGPPAAGRGLKGSTDNCEPPQAAPPGSAAHPLARASEASPGSSSTA